MRRNARGNKLWFLFLFYNYIVPLGFLPWEFSGCFLRGKPAATESRYPTYDACWLFQCVHNPPKFDTDYRILNVRTYAYACNCTRGCTDTVREFSLKVDSRRKIPRRTGESNLPQQCDGPTLYQPSYIPISTAPHPHATGLESDTATNLYERRKHHHVC